MMASFIASLFRMERVDYNGKAAPAASLAVPRLTLPRAFGYKPVHGLPRAAHLPRKATIMTPRLRLAGFLCLAVLLVRVGPGIAAQQDPVQARFDAARLAWDTGDYVKALTEFRAILTGPDGERYLERIALRTGELFTTIEIAKDGRSVRFSPDGAYGAYEAGSRLAPVTRIFAVADPAKTVFEAQGSRLSFSPDGKSAAFLRVPESPEAAQASPGGRRVGRPAGARPAGPNGSAARAGLARSQDGPLHRRRPGL